MASKRWYILTDTLTCQQPAVQALFNAANVTVTIIESTNQWTKNAAGLGFTLDTTPEHPFANMVLNHNLPLITALDTLKTLLTITATA